MTVRARVAVIAITLVFAVSCGPASESADSILDLPTTLPSSIAPASPLEALMYGDLQELESKLERSAEATASCLRDRGWTWARPAGQLLQLAEGFSNPVAYGKQFAYGVSTTVGVDEGSGNADPVAEYVNALNPDETAAYSVDLWGRKGLNDGCMHIGHREVFGNLLVMDATVSQIQQEAFDRVTGDRRVTEAARMWSSCMSKKGYSFQSREDVLRDISERFEALPKIESGLPDAGNAQLHELQVYEFQLYDADTGCFDSTGYEATIRLVRAEVENALIEQHGLGE